MTEAWFRRVPDGERPETVWSARLAHADGRSYEVELRAHEGPSKAGALAAIHDAGNGWSVTILVDGRASFTRSRVDGRWLRRAWERLDKKRAR